MSNTQYPLLRPELRDLIIQGEVRLQQAVGPPSYRRQGEQHSISARIRVGCKGPPHRWRSSDHSRFLPGDLIGIKSMLLERHSNTVGRLTTA